MRVFGDARRREASGEKIERLRAGLARLGDRRPGIERHGALAGWLMAAGELEQALLDGAAAHVSRHLSRLTRRLAEALLDSFRHQGSSYGNTHVEVALRLLREIGGADLPDALDVVVPEGYAVYGLYPETYLRAAARWREEGAGVARVIGIRSIGTSPGAAVAAASGPELAVSVRPGGHPFARTLDLGDRDDRDDRLGRELLAGADRGDI